MSSTTRVGLWLLLAFLPGLILFGAGLWASDGARGLYLTLALIVHVLGFAAVGLALYYTHFRPLAGLAHRAQIVQADAQAGEQAGASNATPGPLAAPSQTPPGRFVEVELERLAAALASLEHSLAVQRKELADAELRHTKAMLEINHRIKNNLQIVSSLLSLQATRLKVPEGRVDFDMARQRLSALALLHRHLYDGKVFQSVELRAFCSDLVEHLRELVGYDRTALVRTHQNVPVLMVGADQAVLIGLVITETVSNAFRHAFPGNRPGNIDLAVTIENGQAHLIVADDGIGLPEGRLSGSTTDLGGLLIAGFVRQLRGTLRITSRPGTRLEITFPLDPVPAA